MDESRKQFEEWFRKFGPEDECTIMLKLNSYGANYLHPHADIAWIAWQASREAIEIKLDDKVMVEDEFDKGHNCAIDYCADAIRAAGIKVKE